MKYALAGETEAYVTIPSCRKFTLYFHDAGGGHATPPLRWQTMATQQQRPWQVELVNFKELTDRF